MSRTCSTILVGQSGGPTAAINASLAGVLDAAAQAGITVLGMRHGIAGLIDGDIRDLHVLTQNTPESQQLRDLLALTPSSWLGSCRKKLPQPELVSAESKEGQVFERSMATLDALAVDAVLYIGGNDSMDTIAKLSTYAERIHDSRSYIGIPKTIDNDLVHIDHTPGFGSAAKFVANAVADLKLDADVYGVPNVLVVEIMGRDAGWLTLSAALGGADLIVLPEHPLALDELTAAVQAKLEHATTVIVAVSEGARTPDGTLYCDMGGSQAELDAFGHAAQQSGACRVVAHTLKQALGCKTRAIEFSTLQRCAMHTSSATDLAHARMLGAFAVELAREGRRGIMASLERTASLEMHLKAVAVTDVANQVRSVPATLYDPSQLCATQEGLAYLAPLIEGSVSLPELGGLRHTLNPVDELCEHRVIVSCESRAKSMV